MYMAMFVSVPRIRTKTDSLSHYKKCLSLRKNIFVDKQSGKDFKRPMYKRMLRKIKKTICFM